MLKRDGLIYSGTGLTVPPPGGGAKCVVSPPRPLLEPPLDVVSIDRAAEGLAHMLDLQEFCRGDVERFSLGEGVTLRVMRRSPSGSGRAM